MNSIVECVFQNALTTPNKLALVDENESVTYLELANRVIKLAKALEQFHVEINDSVLAECTQDCFYITLKLALEVIGSYFVPVEAGVISERLASIYRYVDAKIYIYKTECVQSDMSIVSVEELKQLMKENDASFSLDCKWRQIERGDISEILFSTGTTGDPKGITILNKNNIAIAENIIDSIGVSNTAVEIIPLPLSHSHALRSTYALLMSGSTAVYCNGISNIGSFFELIEKYEVNAMDVSPAILKILFAIAAKGMNSLADRLDYMQIGTSVLDEDLKTKVANLFVKTRVFNSYGMTEAGRSCALEVKESAGKGCVGYATKNSTFTIINEETLEEITSSAEVPGLVAVSGDILCAGYWKNESLTDKTIKKGTLYTNDIGYFDLKGRLVILGRADDVINYKGIKIMPEEIETVAQKYQGVRDCACVPKADKMCGNVPKLFISVQDEQNFSIKAFEKWIAQNIEQIRMPKEIVIIDSIPRTYNGKLQRKKLMGDN